MSIYIPPNLTMVVSNAWWLMVLRGVLVVLLSLLLFFRPETSLVLLVQFLGAYWLVDGIFVAFAAVRHRASESRWWVMGLRGLIGVLAGLFLIFNPVTSAGWFILAAAILALVIGILEIVIAIRIRKEVDNEWSMVLAGLFAIVVGLALLFIPEESTLLMVYLIAAAGIIAGIVSIINGFRLRSSSG